MTALDSIDPGASARIVDTPGAWLAHDLAGYFAYHQGAVADGTVHRAAALDDLLADDAALLRELHAALVASGTPRRAAAMYLCGWFGGAAASALGFALVAADAAFLVDGGCLRWHVHPGGYPDAVELGDAVALVREGHRWAGLPGAQTAAPDKDRPARAVAALAAALAPLVDALRPLGGVGRPALWNEIGDGFGSALAYQTAIPVTAAGVETLRALAAADGAPWRQRSSLWLFEETHGTVCVMQKGGCCLSYTEGRPDPGELDEESRLMLAAFPEPATAPNYCITCRLRDPEDCISRQRWQLAREHADTAG